MTQKNSIAAAGLPAVPQWVLAASQRIWDGGYEAYLVGGCVRDMLLGITPHDYDLCTSAAPAEIKRLFPGERTIDIGMRHGTVALIQGKSTLEITTYRKDGPYQDGRHPQTVALGTSLEEDLARRDFTMNAMAYYPGKGLHDPFDGHQDLQAGIIRCVGKPDERFAEDALRILRGLRFSGRFGFAIHPDTAFAMRKNKERIQIISKERIAQELRGLLTGLYAPSTLAAYADVLFSAVPLFDFAEQKQMLCSLSALAFIPADDLCVKTACLLHGVSFDKADQCLVYLKVSNRFHTSVLQLVQNSTQALLAPDMPLWLSKMGEAALMALLRLQYALASAGLYPADPQEIVRLQSAAEAAAHSGLPLALNQLALRGNDLADAGIVRGKALGIMLHWLHRQVLAGAVPNQREALLEAAQRHAEAQ